MVIINSLSKVNWKVVTSILGAFTGGFVLGAMCKDVTPIPSYREIRDKIWKETDKKKEENKAEDKKEESKAEE